MKEIVEEKIKVFVRIKPVKKQLYYKKSIKESPSKEILKIDNNLNLLSGKKFIPKNTKTIKEKKIKNLITDDSFCKNEKRIQDEKLDLEKGISKNEKRFHQNKAYVKNIPKKFNFISLKDFQNISLKEKKKNANLENILQKDKKQNENKEFKNFQLKIKNIFIEEEGKNMESTKIEKNNSMEEEISISKKNKSNLNSKQSLNKINNLNQNIISNTQNKIFPNQNQKNMTPNQNQNNINQNQNNIISNRNQNKITQNSNNMIANQNQNNTENQNQNNIENQNQNNTENQIQNNTTINQNQNNTENKNKNSPKISKPITPKNFTTPSKHHSPRELSQVKSLIKNGTNKIILDLYSSMKKETVPIIKKERKKLIDKIVKEIDKDISFVKINNNCIADNFKGGVFEYDEVFDGEIKNKEIFGKIMEPNFGFIYKGNNFSVFMYGQTCSGKTFTMKGNFVEDVEKKGGVKKVLDVSTIKRFGLRSKERDHFSSSSKKKNIGLIQMTLNKIFKDLEAKKNINFQVKFSYYEIYNEKIYDLLGNSETPLEIREDKSKKINILKLKKPLVRNYKEAMQYFTIGEKKRHFAATEWNHNSSRSHVVFSLQIEIRSKDKFLKSLYSTITLADLAGSESIGNKKKNKLIKEGAHINKSLLALSNVIKKLNKNNKYISFRDSKLTRILKPVLSGNSRTCIICTINPLKKYSSETINTLRFGISAGGIKMKVQQNIKDLQTFTENNILKKEEMEEELQKMKNENFFLKEKNLDLVLKNEFFKEKVFVMEREKETTDILIKNFEIDKEEIEGFQEEIDIFKKEIKDLNKVQIVNMNNFDGNLREVFSKGNDVNKENLVDLDYLRNKNKELEKKLKDCEYVISFQNFNRKKNNVSNDNIKKVFPKKKIKKKIKNSLPKEDYIKRNKELIKKNRKLLRNEEKILERERNLKEIVKKKNDNLQKLKKLLQDNYVMNL